MSLAIVFNLDSLQRAKFSVIGFIKEIGSIAALFVGKQDGKELVYAGKVGTG